MSQEQGTLPEMAEKIVIRDPHGKPMIAEVLNYVEIGGIRFTLVKLNKWYTVTELSTGTNIGESYERDTALRTAKATLEMHGMDLFHSRVAEKLRETGALPSVEEVQKAQSAQGRR